MSAKKRVILGPLPHLPQNWQGEVPLYVHWKDQLTCEVLGVDSSDISKPNTGGGKQGYGNNT